MWHLQTCMLAHRQALGSTMWRCGGAQMIVSVLAVTVQPGR